MVSLNHAFVFSPVFFPYEFHSFASERHSRKQVKKKSKLEIF